MTKINLLPWREEQREGRKKSFFVALGIVVAFAGGMVFLAGLYVNTGIDNQKARNDFLDEQIAVVNRKIKEIRELRDQKAKLTERMSVIQDLQGTRPIIVRLFDELVRTLPSNVYYTSVTRTGDSILVEGIAASNNLVSELMRRFEDSDWFATPVLSQVTAAPGEAVSSIQESTRNVFSLNVKLTTPEPEQE